MNQNNDNELVIFIQEKQRNLTGPGRGKRKEVMDAYDIAFHKAWKSQTMEVVKA